MRGVHYVPHEHRIPRSPRLNPASSAVLVIFGEQHSFSISVHVDFLLVEADSTPDQFFGLCFTTLGYLPYIALHFFKSRALLLITLGAAGEQ
jgi:hypothetical protein